MNIAMILGRIGGDPEVKYIGGGGHALCKFSVATSRKFINKDNNTEEKTEWHNVVFWGKTAEIIGKHFQKGDPILVHGRIETRSWSDDNGVKKYITEIIGERFEFIPKPAQQTASVPNYAPGAEDNSEIPF